MRFRLVALIVAVLCGLTACTSDAPTDPPSTSGPAVLTPPHTSPISTPAPITSSSTTPTPAVPTTGPNTRPGEKPPTLPALGRDNSPAGAATFASYWFRALDWGYATTDPTLAAALYLRSCSECDRFVNIFRRAAAEHAYLTGGRITVTAVSVAQDATHSASTPIDVTFDQSRIQKHGRSGQLLKSAPAQQHVEYRTWLRRSNGGWSVVDMKQIVRK